MTLHFRNYDSDTVDDRLSNNSIDVTDTGPRRSARSRQRKLYRSFGKRVLDLSLTIVAAPFVLTAVTAAAAVIALDGHNPFYSQERLGQNGKTFRIWKLRTMVRDADQQLDGHLEANPAAQQEWELTQKLKDDPRITRVGRVLRKTSLDELPQFFNVLTGSMSLVGPRPMMTCQRAYYPGTRYFNLKPGISGLWQVSDRNESSFADRVRFDDAYDRALSLRTDLSILWRTVKVVLRRTGY